MLKIMTIPVAFLLLATYATAFESEENTRIREEGRLRYQETVKKSEEQRRARKEAELKRAGEEFAKMREEAKTEAAEEEAAEARLRSKCGNDYLNIRVGMKLKRVEECVTPVSLIGQAHLKGDIVSHYEGQGLDIYVKKGNVVMWSYR